MQITLKLRICDKHASELNRQARAVNFVWNFCNETQRHAIKWGKKWPSGFDLQKLTAGSFQELQIGLETLAEGAAL
jgi:putative transposase